VGIARKWVFPIIRLIIFAAIAVALVKVAFFADMTPAENPAMPTGQITEPRVEVTSGTIKNDVKLTGVVAADPAIPVRATLAGDVLKLLVVQGQHVDPETPVATIRQELPRDDGSMSYKTVTVKAGAAGTLSNLAVIVGQTVSVGEAVGQVAPASFNVSGPLDPAQQYRLLNQPTEAQVTISGGPAPFSCTGLTISTALTGASADGAASTGGDAGSSGTTVRCAVPADVKVFAGLAAQLTIPGGKSENALTVPMTAVEGGAGSGNVYLVQPDGTTKKVPVTLGLNDGKSVEITAGVNKGDFVLQFVPGAPAKSDDANGNCVGTVNGMVCGG
jgi:multidrug efflux pump subunit AcrA (membrane-fusion protein)